MISVALAPTANSSMAAGLLEEVGHGVTVDRLERFSHLLFSSSSLNLRSRICLLSSKSGLLFFSMQLRRSDVLQVTCRILCGVRVFRPH